MMSFEMYEDFKETMIKTIKTELSAKNSQSVDGDLPQGWNRSFVPNKSGIRQ